MSVFEKQRFEIWNAGQHPYRHTLAEFSYSNPAMPGVSNTEGALNYILAVLYPNTKPSVATPAALPSSGNTLNDYRVVTDDGDGKAAGYRWEQREGEVSPSWHKIYDMDWGQDSILEAFQNRTDDRYVMRRGYDDIDGAGNPITGFLAGQSIYGGKSASTNLTLYANSGDGVSSNTGYVQVGDHFRPLANATYDLGTTTEKFRALYTSGSAFHGTLTVGSGSVSDSSGAITFGSNNLTTTGTFTAGAITGSSLVAKTGSHTTTVTAGSIVDSANAITFGSAALSTTGAITAASATFGGTLALASGSITDSGGTISHGTNNVTTSGTITGNIVNGGNLQLSSNTLAAANTNGGITLSALGTGVVNVTSALTTIGQSITGNIGVSGQVNVGAIRLTASTISTTTATTDLTVSPTGTFITSAVFKPSADATLDLGVTGARFRNIYLSGSITNGTTTVAYSALSGLRAVLFRDVAQTQAAQTGDALFYDATSGLWLASVPDSEISHASLSGLTSGDAGHTQFALLTGRAGGQTLRGDTASSGNLVLESTFNATKGFVLTKDPLAPFSTAVFSTTWSGTNLGGTSNYFNNVYAKGEYIGFRLENVLSSSLPAASAQNIGRVVFATDNKKAYVDIGTGFNVLGVAKFLADQTFDGIITQLDVTVSATITDARNAIWTLLDNTNSFQRMMVDIQSISATQVRIKTNMPLPSGSYRLIGVE